MEQVSNWYRQLVESEQTWVVEVFVVVLLTLLANFLAVRVLHQFQRHLTKTRNVWDDILFEAMSRPVAYLIWVIGFGWAADIVKTTADTTLLEATDTVRDVLVIAIIAWFLVRFIRLAEGKIVADHAGREGGVDETTARALGRLLRAAVFITAALVVLQSLGYSIGGVLAFGGIGGIAVGFAAKDILSNFFGGLMIYLDRPFAVGDWIRSPDKDIEGTVEDVGWRQTRIRTFDKRPLYVPNSVFASIAVENPSRMLNRRIYETIGLRYDDAAQVEQIVADVKAMLQQHPEIDTRATLIVNFNAFGPSSLDFFVYAFTKTTDWIRFHEIKQDILLKILALIAERGADVAYPTSTLKVEPLVMQGRATESSTTN